jgi:hypothetical protein
MFTLSNVRGGENTATPATARGRFSNMRLYEPFCLVNRKEASGSITEITHDLGKRGGTPMPKWEMFMKISRLDAEYFTEN